MPMANARACDSKRAPNCTGIALPNSWACGPCTAISKGETSDNSAIRRGRYPAQYDKFRDAVKAYGNVFCQHVESGTRIRCRNLAEILHHLLAADDYPQFLTNHKKRVRVCRSHHPHTTGDPGGIEYTPTIWPAMLGGAPRVDTIPGERVPGEVILWTLASQRRILLG